MKTSIRQTLFALILGLSLTGCLEGEGNKDPNNLPDIGTLGEGLTLENGIFTPRPQQSELNKLILGYNSAEDKVKYFGNLSSSEQALLYQELPQNAKEIVLSAFLWEAGYLAGSDGSWTQWPGLPPAEKAAMKKKFNEFLKALPSGEAGEVLNKRSDLIYFTRADLSGVDLTGWDPGISIDMDLRYTDLSNAKITIQQLDEIDKLDFAKLRGIDLSGWETPNDILRGVDLRDTKFSSNQLNGLLFYGLANLSGLNLAGLDLSPRQLPDGSKFQGDVNGVDFSNTNITASQLARAYDIGSAKLKGTGITRATLVQAIKEAGREESPPLGLDTVIYDN